MVGFHDLKAVLSPQSTKNKDEENVSENLDGVVIADKIDTGSREIGVFSAIFLILNRIVGTGIFATPSTIYSLAGSVGFAMVLWLVGTIIGFTGLLVYMEWGVAIPRNGGEKNYLEYVYTKPRFLATAMYATYVFFLGWASGNSIVFGQYILTAAEVDVTRWNQRGIGIACITFAFLVHSLAKKWGIYLQNVLGIFKLVVIVFIAITGWVALGGGIHNDEVAGKANFKNSFEGTTSSAYAIVTCLYNIIWSYVGYSNANYALGEAKNPVKTLKIAAPIAYIFVAIIYMLVNVAYFAVVPKEQFASSGTILAATFFKIAFGSTAQKAMSVLVAISALGNVMSVIFSQGRIIQQLGREGILPFPKFFATSKPFNSPFVGLFQHWVVCIITIIAPPPGDAYNFIMNLISYPLNVVNAFVAGGLLYIYLQKKRGKITWDPPFHASIPVTLFFFLANLFLIVAPYIAPDGDNSVYIDLPYWLHCVVGTGILLAGGIYWIFWRHICPRIFNYEIITKEVIGDDGFWRNDIRFVKGSRGSIDENLNTSDHDSNADNSNEQEKKGGVYTKVF